MTNVTQETTQGRFPLSLPSPAILVDRLEVLVRSRLWAQILLSMVLAIAIGLSLSPEGGALVSESLADILASWLALPGKVFLALIQMIVVPLVMSSVILGIASSGDADYVRRAGFRIGPYFVFTTVIAAVIGMSVATWIEPGNYVDPKALMGQSETVSIPQAPPPLDGTNLPDRIVDLIPTNPAAAIHEGRMLQLVVLAILAGIALVSLASRHSEPLITLLSSVQELSMKIVSWAMLFAPVAVFGLLAQVSIKVGSDAIFGLSVYIGTVLLGLALLIGAYLVIVGMVAARSPWSFLASVRAVQLLAFSTSSSAAVLPLSMKTAEEDLGIDRSVSQFVIPLGANINMDGTALYQVVAALFLTQAFGVELSNGQLVLLTATTVGASIGAPSAPGVGIVILATILQGIGVPPAGIGMIIGVDRLLDMSRTAVNVTGDLAACAVLDRWLPSVPADAISPHRGSGI